MECEPPVEDDISLDELLHWGEFGCWTAIVLFPFLYYVNGPAVSTDQFVVRTTLVTFVLIAAPVLRWRNWRESRRTAAESTTQSAEAASVPPMQSAQQEPE